MSPLTEPTKLVLKKDPVLADPYYHNVSLLLHGDGANGSTTIVDSSPSPKTVTAYGDAQISTAQSKFGGASIAFDGNGDYLNATTGDFGTGDFTVETWIYVISYVQSFATIVATRENPASYTDRWTLAISSSGFLVFYTNGFKINNGSISTGVWTHIAVSRQGNNLRGFVNGTLVNTDTGTLQNFSRNFLYIGNNFNNSEPFNGYIDDLRITKGVARYTANFTPPTAPFPEVIG